MPELVICITKDLITDNTLEEEPLAGDPVTPYDHSPMKDIQPSKEPSEFTSNRSAHPLSGRLHSKCLVSSAVHRCKVALIDYKTEEVLALDHRHRV